MAEVATGDGAVSLNLLGFQSAELDHLVLLLVSARGGVVPEILARPEHAQLGCGDGVFAGARPVALARIAAARQEDAGGSGHHRGPVGGARSRAAIRRDGRRGHGGYTHLGPYTAA